jgi:hypothetical protein
MIALKLLSAACFLIFWWRSKRSSSAQVSDFFILSFLIIFLPGYIFMPTGETTLNALDLSDEAALAAGYGFSLALICGAVVFYLRQRLRPSSEKFERPKSTPPHGPSLFWSICAIAASLLIFALLMLNTEFRDFKWNALRYLTINLDGPEYRTLRGKAYEQSWVVESLVGRLRFTLFPVLLCLVIYPFLIRKRYIYALIASLIFFVILPGSLSKLPILFFAGYVALLFVQQRRALLDIESLTILSIVSSGLMVGILSLLYFGQYRIAIMSGTLQPVPLALERIWGEPYSIIVRYFAVYPEMKSFTGFSGINLIAQAIGVPVRMPDIEVARTVLGPDSGSNPGVFFVGGYAAFGFFGIAVFSFIGFGLLWLLDEIQTLIQTPILRATYFATVGMNVIFLNQIALQTALITYGLAVIPIIILLLDRTARRILRQ